MGRIWVKNELCGLEDSALIGTSHSNKENDKNTLI